MRLGPGRGSEDSRKVGKAADTRMPGQAEVELVVQRSHHVGVRSYGIGAKAQLARVSWCAADSKRETATHAHSTGA